MRILLELSVHFTEHAIRIQFSSFRSNASCCMVHLQIILQQQKTCLLQNSAGRAINWLGTFYLFQGLTYIVLWYYVVNVRYVEIDHEVNKEKVYSSVNLTQFWGSMNVSRNEPGFIFKILQPMEKTRDTQNSRIPIEGVSLRCSVRCVVEQNF